MANTYSPVDDLDDLRRDLSAVNENIASTALDDLDHDQDGDLDELDLKTANIGSKTIQQNIVIISQRKKSPGSTSQMTYYSRW